MTRLDLRRGGCRRRGDVPRPHRHAPRVLPADRRAGRAVVGTAMAPEPPEPTGRLVALQPLPTDQVDTRPPEQLIFRRRSTRKYTPRGDPVRGVLHAARSFDARRRLRRARAGAPLTDLYLIVNGVEGLAPGVYLHHPQLGAVELLREGTFRAEATRIRGRSAVRGRRARNLYYLAHLPSILGLRNPRLPAGAARRRPARRANCTSAPMRSGWARSAPSRLSDEGDRLLLPHRQTKDDAFVTAFGETRVRSGGVLRPNTIMHPKDVPWNDLDEQLWRRWTASLTDLCGCPRRRLRRGPGPDLGDPDHARSQQSVLRGRRKRPAGAGGAGRRRRVRLGHPECSAERRASAPPGRSPWWLQDVELSARRRSMRQRPAVCRVSVVVVMRSISFAALQRPRRITVVDQRRSAGDLGSGDLVRRHRDRRRGCRGARRLCRGT